MSDSRICPINPCDHPIRAGDLMCHRHWYVVPDHLRTAYTRARDRFRRTRMARHCDEMLAAGQDAIDSVSPRRNA